MSADKGHSKYNLKNIVAVSPLLAVALFLFSGCFTGIESTPKIKLNREDRKEVERINADDSRVANINATTADTWQPGHPFIVLAEEVGRALNSDHSFMIGDTLYFKQLNNRLSPGGDKSVDVILRDEEGSDYTYQSGLNDAALLASDRLPMLADGEIIRALDERLRDAEVWVLPGNWFTPEGVALKGRRFAPVTIAKVTAGKTALPYLVHFHTIDGTAGCLYLTLKGSSGANRPFHTLFSFADPRTKYKRISDEHWELICNSQVVPGMTKEECRLALGTPSSSDSGRDYAHLRDLWVYPDGKRLRFEDSILVEIK